MHLVLAFLAGGRRKSLVMLVKIVLDFERTKTTAIPARTNAVTIQQVSRSTGFGAHTLRYHERIGLLRPIPHMGNGYRQYSAGRL